jgi:hypothetical protein
VNLSPTARYISAEIQKMKLSEGTTLSQMANKLNISYAQIRNLKDLKVEKPTFTTAIKFFIMLRTERDKRAQLMKEDYPEMYKHEQEQEERAPAGTIDPEYSRKISVTTLTYRIYSIANSNAGIKRSLVKNLWGQSGEQVLDELIHEEILTEKDGSVRSTAELHRDKDREIMRKNQQHCLDIVDLNDIGDLGSWLSLVTDSVNCEAYKKIRREIIQSYYKVGDIIRDTASKGEIPVFFNINLGKFLHENQKGQA